MIVEHVEQARPRRFVVALLVVALALVALGLLLAPPAEKAPVPPDAFSDDSLYALVLEQYRDGEGGYHELAVQAQRDNGYPVLPFLTVREPTLTWLGAALGGPDGLRVALGVLLAATFVVVMVSLDGWLRTRWWILGSLVFGLAAAGLLAGNIQMYHEGWAMLLVLNAILVRRPHRWWPSVLLGLAAVLFRELAVGYLLVMLVLAVAGRRRGEAAAWLAAIAAFGAFMAWHAAQVAELVRPGDPTSPGWSAWGGWSFVLGAVRDTTLLAAAPGAVTAVLVPLALWAWCSTPGATATRVALSLVGYVAAFCVLGRPQNTYWGLLFAAPLLTGLGLLPAAVRRTSGRGVPGPTARAD